MSAGDFPGSSALVPLWLGGADWIAFGVPWSSADASGVRIVMTGPHLDMTPAHRETVAQFLRNLDAALRARKLAMVAPMDIARIEPVAGIPYAETELASVPRRQLPGALPILREQAIAPGSRDPC